MNPSPPRHPRKPRHPRYARKPRGLAPRPGRRRLILALPLALTGCVAGPPTAPQPVDLPPSFSQKGGDTAMPAQWWTRFDDPGLNKAITLALGRNFDLKTAWDRLHQAQAIAVREGAARYPTLTASGEASRRDRYGGVNAFVNPASNTFTLGLAATYEVDLWGRLSDQYDATRFDLYGSRQDLQAAALSLAGSVASAWYQLAEQRAQLRVLELQQRTNRQLLDLVTGRFRQGQVPASDVLRQRQLVESARGEQALAQAQARVLEHQLAVLVGRPPGTDLGLTTPTLADLPPLPATGVPASLVERRPDVRSAFLGVYAADRRLAAAIADRYPRLSLSADVQTTGGEIRDLFNNLLVSVGANAVQPLFDAGERAAEADRTRAVKDEAINRYGQTVLTAVQDVEDALSNGAQQREYLQSLSQQLDTLESVVRRSRARYLNGQGDYLTILDAITTQQNLQRTYITARQQALEFRINLYRALAGPIPMTPPVPPTLAPPEAPGTPEAPNPPEASNPPDVSPVQAAPPAGLADESAQATAPIDRPHDDPTPGSSSRDDA